MHDRWLHTNPRKIAGPRCATDPRHGLVTRFSEQVPRPRPSRETKHSVPLFVACSFFMEQLDSTSSPPRSRDGEEPWHRAGAAQPGNHQLHPQPRGVHPDQRLIAIVRLAPVFCAAIIVFTSARAVRLRPPRLSMLVATRVLQGMGGAMLSPVGRLILCDSSRRKICAGDGIRCDPGTDRPDGGTGAGRIHHHLFQLRWIFYVNIPWADRHRAGATLHRGLSRHDTEPFRSARVHHRRHRPRELQFASRMSTCVAPAVIATSFVAAAVALTLFGWHCVPSQPGARPWPVRHPDVRIGTLVAASAAPA